MTDEQVVSNIMRAMYPRRGKSTPEQVILLNALKINGGLDAQVRSAISTRGRRRTATATATAQA